jgi:hypothetical protein
MPCRSCQCCTRGVGSSGVCNPEARIDATDRPDRAPSFPRAPSDRSIGRQERGDLTTEAAMTPIGRIHHITAIASAADRNLAFHESALGCWQQRLAGLGITVEGPAERFGERLISS